MSVEETVPPQEQAQQEPVGGGAGEKAEQTPREVPGEQPREKAEA